MSPRKRRDASAAAFDHFAAGSGVNYRIDALGPTGDEADRIIRIPLHALVASRSQPRAPITPESVTDLARQIRGVDLLHPVTVCPVMSEDGVVERYEIVAGHRRVEAYRLLAAEDAQYATVPAIVRSFDELQKVVATHVENFGRKKLTVWETARAIAGLREALVAAGQPSTVSAVRERLGHVGDDAEIDGDPTGNGEEDPKKALSRGSVAQYLQIGAVVTEMLLRAAGAHHPSEPGLDYALIGRLQHRDLMRVVRAAVGERVEVLRDIVAGLRAPRASRTSRARGSEKPEPIGRGGAPEYSPAAVPAARPTPTGDAVNAPASVATQGLSPEQAREALDRLLPQVAALAEIARNGQMVLTADAGSLLVAFIRPADPSSRAGQLVRDTLVRDVAAHFAEFDSRTTRAVTSVVEGARSRRV